MIAQEQEILMMYNTLPETEQGLVYELLPVSFLHGSLILQNSPPPNAPTWKNPSAI